MVKEPKHIDFYTTGNEPSQEDFAKISELIKTDKEANGHKTIADIWNPISDESAMKMRDSDEAIRSE